ncbi:DUF2200 domain-containing protein [Cognatishimia activa]|uniref:DUF2200 domain-containing protein n=1 Tax=Cognatishimia activa TaxID=1715691 RepID=UPI002230C346|nr:DUF2200 domain-containing protein [Cognatishimia activa]UZD91165.1 DUF2200 domain-containing protein [Cognatishimia activa]
MNFASIYPHNVSKVEKIDRSKAQLDEIIAWLTGYDATGLEKALYDERDFEAFFAEPSQMNRKRDLIKEAVCGVRDMEIEDPLMREIRNLDRLLDELALGKNFNNILRG